MNTYRNYRNYIIETIPNNHTAYIYNTDGNLVKCIAGNIDSNGNHNALDKAKAYINNIFNT